MASTYYCDDCAHVFNTPTQAVFLSKDPKHKECPRCGSRDFECLQLKEDANIPDNDNEMLKQLPTIHGYREEHPVA